MNLFGWMRSRPAAPPLSKGNPGRGVALRVGFANTQSSWEEEARLVDELAKVLESKHIEHRRYKA
jgi:hypothetical protein